MLSISDVSLLSLSLLFVVDLMNAIGRLLKSTPSMYLLSWLSWPSFSLDSAVVVKALLESVVVFISDVFLSVQRSFNLEIGVSITRPFD